MRTIIWFLYFWLYLLFVLPANRSIRRKLKKGETAKARSMTDTIVKKWAASLLKAAGVTVSVEGTEHIPKDAALFVANHQGNFDIPLVLSQLGPLKSVVAKKELARMPGIYSWMTYFNCLFMDRQDPRQSLKCLTEAQEMLKQGHSLIIFPEGTRSKGPVMGEFKPGALRCALKAEVPIVPVVIDGSYLAMEAHGFWIHPAHVRITILPPVATKELEKERTKAISDDVRHMIADALALSMEKRNTSEK